MRNNLATIQEEVFYPNPPNTLNYFRIFDNPLMCGDNLKWLKQADTSWLTVYSPYSTMCSLPVELNETSWNMLTVDDLYYAGLY